MGLGLFALLFTGFLGTQLALPKLLKSTTNFIVMIRARRQLYRYAESKGLTRDQADLYWGATHVTGIYNPASWWYKFFGKF